ncbi:MAG TPA: isoleucine--tRNA ligase [Longimicrobiales bacterium]|nr:isoleucine--tRNA ligase [Longimicrobiales bacterium]
MKYPEYPPSATALEEQVLARWREEDLFRRTLAQTEGAAEFVFFEGPPTANGRPGIHHVLSRTIKDIVCRYHTMRGCHVTRIAGWDTHGLPVEIEAEKRLGISGKRDIERIGVAQFNAACRESVFTYKEEWERLSERMGYWLDYSRPYVTFEPEYIESVWWILRQLDERSLIYRGHKSVPYCPRCGTALSSHEVAQGYEIVADPSIYFAAPLSADPTRAFLVWTTTPWTLPANAALALHPAIEYVEVRHSGGERGGGDAAGIPAGGGSAEPLPRSYILAAARVAALFGDDAEIIARYAAPELAGMRYERPFDYFAAGERADAAFRVVLEEFVTAEDGTGIVHMAPAFGADDYAAGQRHGLPLFRPVDDAGRFRADTPVVGGQFVKDADAVLVQALRERGRVFRYALEEHSYPHCWRCDTPLLYMARDAWYIRTTQVKQRMLEHNAQVSWHPPEIGSGRFGEWLEGNVDWAISRERYWGTPLPFWVCDADASHTRVIGSFDELQSHAGELPQPFDPHKPFIDEVTFACECGATMRRTPEVLDVWFDSGAMPYAQWHYPFENQELFRSHFPADYICEGVDQTRGWFYSLMAIATMLDMGPAFRNVIVNDLVLDADGQKMSKSRGNTVDPWLAIEQFGVDAIRWYFVTASQPWIPKRFDPAALGDAARRAFDTLANTYRFYALYANLEGWTPADDDPPVWERGIMDRWIISRLAQLVSTLHQDFDGYDLTHGARAIGDFIVDDLSNWYVRRSRDRFWGSAGDATTRAAFRTLHEVLDTLARVLAPLTPFHADWLYRALNDGHSVHLAPYPFAGMGAARDERLEEGMRVTRSLARLGRAARERVKIRVRQPLGVLQAVVPDETVMTPELLAVLKDELNVKTVQFLQAAGELVSLRAQPNFRQIGRRFGGDTQQAAQRIRELDAAQLRAFRRGEAVRIELAGAAHVLQPGDLDVIEEAAGDLVVETAEGCTIALDPTIDELLRLEGLARELVNRVQRLRKDSGLAVSDRIALGVFGDADVRRALELHGDYVASETLAVDIVAHAAVDPAWSDAQQTDLDGASISIGIRRMDPQ